jgi:hypothetical protein
MNLNHTDLSRRNILNLATLQSEKAVKNQISYLLMSSLESLIWLTSFIYQTETTIIAKVQENIRINSTLFKIPLMLTNI